MQTNKTMYFTREEAEYARDKFENGFINQYARIYKCEFCPAWHLTHRRRHNW